MIEGIFQSAFVRRRMAGSHLGIILRDFVVHLHARGHAKACIQSYAQIAEHFSRWLGCQRLRWRQIDERVIERFVRRHLPRCSCARPAPTHAGNCRAALGRLLAFLRRRGLVRKSSPARRSVIDHVLAEYDRHLQEVAGVAPSTRRYRCRYAREFLQTRLHGGRLRWRPMAASDLLRYMQLRAPALKPASLRVLTGALRDFLRFLQLTGRGEERWVAAVPRPAPWPRSLLPQTLSREQVRALLTSFERMTRIGRRDYAMTLCLTQLGLRVSEVAGLSLEDVDWRRCTLRLRQTKQRRERLLPLPPLVARAIASYLRSGRPSTDTRALFVRHRAPLGRALEAHHVRGAMRRALARSEIGVTRIHLLRHTFATALHQKGVGLKALADVLGHQCLDTAARYARVNLRELRQAALPWPEDRS
jgi:integrase/recombinase XerD